MILERGHQTVLQMPIVAGLSSSSSEEHLSDITYSLRESGNGTFELNATAKSNLWSSNRRFQWRFFPEHVEFQQFASGSGKLGRCYLLSNGVSNLWDNGATDGHAWETSIYVDRYYLAIQQDRQRGQSIREIAKGHRISTATVQRVLRKQPTHAQVQLLEKTA